MATAVESRHIVTGGPRPSRGTLVQIFFDAVERHDKPDALQSKVSGTYQPISHRTLATRVQHTGLGLRSLGIDRGARVGILSENRPEWAIVDYACLTSGLVDVPVYPTLPAEQVAYILKDAGVSALFVSTATQAAKIAEVRGTLPALRHVIGFGDEAWPGVDLTFSALEARGTASGTSAAQYREAALRTAPDDLATLIYTSGTTGEPKGVMLTHDNFYSNVAACADILPFKNDIALSFLPLSHVFERMGDYLMMACGVSIAYAESIETVPTNMLEVRPTVMMSVPRLYEKMYARVLENALAGGAIKKRIFFWVRGVADRWANETLAGRAPRSWLTVAYRVAQKLVFSKLKARTGGRMRYFVSGGAPLAPEINKPEATREAIDTDGWFHTGDIGELRDGFLAITDRKKDIIATAGGKKIAPQPIENMIKTSKYVSQAVMLGDKRKYPVVLVVPNFEQLEKWAKIKNLLWADRRQLINLPLVQAKMEKEVLRKLSGLASFETPKKVGLLENDFSIESGEMTPSHKVKRRVIEKRYADRVNRLYEGEDASAA
jgi:long-chain acyl-CoA synthetase